jgi:hypothetical protein
MLLPSGLGPTPCPQAKSAGAPLNPKPWPDPLRAWGRTCAGVSDQQHMNLAPDVGASLIEARHAAHHHQRGGQLDNVQAVDL